MSSQATSKGPKVGDQIMASIKRQTKGALHRQSVERAHLRPTEVKPHSAAEATGQKSGINYQSILSPVISYELYNPGDEPIEFGYGGETYVLPGANDLWVGRDARSGELMEYSRPGVLPVFGRPDRVFGGQHFPIDALDIVRHAVGEDGRSGHVGVNGVRLLFMDDRDADVIQEARESWVEKRRFDMEAMVRAHEAFNALAIQQGREQQRPAKRVKDAYRWLEENERAGGITESCPICNDGFRDEREVQIHVVTYHKKHALAVEYREALGMEEDIIDRNETITESNDEMKGKRAKAVASARRAQGALDGGHSDEVPDGDEPPAGDAPPVPAPPK